MSALEQQTVTVGPPHIVSAEQFNRPLFELIADMCQVVLEEMIRIDGATDQWPKKLRGLERVRHASWFMGDYSAHLMGRIVKVLFKEASSRTFDTFTIAALSLGGKVIGSCDPKNTSSSKGETTRSEIRMAYEQHVAAIVYRTREPFDPHRIAYLSSQYPELSGKIPGKNWYSVIFNAGDGKHQHPSQAVLDLYTILNKLGRIDHFTLLVTGDISQSRTIKSLLLMIANCCHDVKVRIAVPIIDGLSTGLDQGMQVLVDHLTTKGVVVEVIDVHQRSDFDAAMDGVHILYATRPQLERCENNEDRALLYRGIVELVRVDNDLLIRHPHVLVFHPLPSTGEIQIADTHPQAAYIEQASRGVVMRMVLMLLALLHPHILIEHGNSTFPFDPGWSVV